MPNKLIDDIGIVKTPTKQNLPPQSAGKVNLKDDAGILSLPASGEVSYYDNSSIDPRWGGITKSGEKFDEKLPTAAVLPQYWKQLRGKTIRVTNPENNKSIDVKVNDTGGFGKYGRILDLSKSAFESISDRKKGTGKFKIEILPEKPRQQLNLNPFSIENAYAGEEGNKDISGQGRTRVESKLNLKDDINILGKAEKNWISEGIKGTLADITAIPFRALGVRAPAEGAYFSKAPSIQEWLAEPVGMKLEAIQPPKPKEVKYGAPELGLLGTTQAFFTGKAPGRDVSENKYQKAPVTRGEVLLEAGLQIGALAVVGKLGYNELKNIFQSPQVQSALQKVINEGRGVIWKGQKFFGMNPPSSLVPVTEEQIIQAYRKGDMPFRTASKYSPTLFQQAIAERRISEPEALAYEAFQPAAGGLAPASRQGIVQNLKSKGIEIQGIEGMVRLTQDVSVLDEITKQKQKLSKGHEFFEVKLSDGKIWLHDGKDVIIDKDKLNKIEKENQPLGEKQFAPELKDVEVVVKGAIPTAQELGIDVNAPGSAETYKQTLKQKGLDIKQETKFSQYQLPGGENYREVLIKAPSPKKQLRENERGRWDIIDDKGKLIAGNLSKKFAEEEIKLYPDISEGQFKSSHWDEPNVLTHIRMNNRATPDGKKVLFIEELQSDWAAAVRKQEIRQPSEAELKIIMEEQGLNKEDAIKWSLSQQSGTRFPTHPLLKNWQELALKQVLKTAVEGNYDAISWTTGEQQAERYDLSKQIDLLTYEKDKSGLYTINGLKDNKIVITKDEISAKELPSVVSKDIAEKIIKGEGRKTGYGTTELSGQDLKIGGEWADNLYDKQIPNILKDLTKGKIGDVNIGNLKDTIGIDTNPKTGNTDVYNVRTAKILFSGGKEQAHKFYNSLEDKIITKSIIQPSLQLTPEVKAKILGQPMAGGKVAKKETKPTKISDIIGGKVPPTRPPTTVSGAPAPEEKPIVNVEHLNISKENKEKIKKVAKQIAPELEKNKGPLTHNEVLEAAKASQILRKSQSREQTKKLEAAILRTKQHLAAISGEKVDKEFIDTLKTLVDQGTAAARTLESLKILGDPQLSDIKIKILKELLKLNTDTDKIIEEANMVDWTNAEEVTKFYRQFVKPSLSDILNEYAYVNILSSPRTHIVNAFSNMLQLTFLDPATKLASGLVDKIASNLPGYQRNHYFIEIPTFYKGAFNAIPQAISNFCQVMLGKALVERPDILHMATGAKFIDYATLGIGKYVPRALEASDILFRTMIQEGEKEALAARATKQGKELNESELSKIQSEAERIAQYYVFRQKPGEERQGGLLRGIDEITKAVYSLRRVPGVRWFIRFVQTPMEIFKQGIEYGPTGFGTIPGAKDKVEQIGKAIVGSAVFLGAAILALQGRTTWKAPRNEEERKIFFSTGRQTFSVNIGTEEKPIWVSYSKIGPLAYPIAMASAIHWYMNENPRGVTDSQLERMRDSLYGIMEFLGDQSYVSSLNDIFESFKGDEAGKRAQLRTLTNVPRQLIPLVSLQGWVARLIDPVFRKVDAKTSIQTIQQDLMKGIPGLSKKLPAYTNEKGEIEVQKYPFLNAVSPLGITPGDIEAEKQYQKAQKIISIKTFESEETKKLREKAEVIYKQLSELPPKEANRRAKEIQKKNKQLFDYIKRIAEDKKLGLSYSERLVKNLGVNDGARAKYIYQEVMQLRSNKERNAYIKDLINKKIISEKVLLQLQYLIKKKR